jgi:hypothetical protein
MFFMLCFTFGWAIILFLIYQSIKNITYKQGNNEDTNEKSN